MKLKAEIKNIVLIKTLWDLEGPKREKSIVIRVKFIGHQEPHTASKIL